MLPDAGQATVAGHDLVAETSSGPSGPWAISSGPGTTTVTFSRAGYTLVVHRVPAEVCDNCQAYVEGEVTAELLRLSAEMRELGAVLVVRDHVAAA